MSETWVEEDGWKKVRDKLLEGFIWGWQAATKKHVKGRWDCNRNKEGINRERNRDGGQRKRNNGGVCEAV